MGDPPSRVLSLFSGIGGLDLAFRMAFPGARTVCYVEREAYAVAVLAARIRDGLLDGAPIWMGDARQFDADAWRGQADAVLAGFPCPAVSTAGRQLGVADSRWLWPEVLRVARGSGASWIIVENVPGLLNANAGRAFGAILGDLASLGFDAEWTSLGAHDVGASHLRKRVFLLAHVAHPQSGGKGATELGRPSCRPVQSRADVADHGRVPGQDGLQRPVPGPPDPADPGEHGHPLAVSDRYGRDGATLRPEGLARSTPSEEAGAEPACGSTPVADPFGLRGDLSETSGADHPRRASPAETGGEVGDGHLPGLEGRGDGPGVGDTDELPAWPPGPEDRAGWERVLARWPDLAPATAEPSIHRLADGPAAPLDIARRAHALRALGNAVVPLQATVALRELYRRSTVGSATEEVMKPYGGRSSDRA